MRSELKIRIDDAKVAETMILSLGGKFIKEMNVTDMYLASFPNEVRKIRKNEEGLFLVELEKEDDRFKIMKCEKIDENDKDNLDQQYGMTSIITKKQRFFSFENHTITINIIEGLGDFLIVEGDMVNKSIFQRIGIESPVFITKTFAQLKDER